MTKPTKWHVCPAKTQISLGIRTVWSESSLSAWRMLWSLATCWAHSKDSDQTGQMPRLIWVFPGCTVILLVLSWDGSYRIEGSFRQMSEKSEGSLTALWKGHFSHEMAHCLLAILTFTFMPSTGFPYNPANSQEDVLEDAERWDEERLVFILHHEEIHLVFPDLYRVVLHLLKHMTETYRCQMTARGQDEASGHH